MSGLSFGLQLQRGSKLRERFVLFFVMLAVVPLLAFGGVALYLIDLSHRQDVSKLELQLIDQKSEEIEKFFTDTIGILELRVGFTQKAEIESSQQEFILTGLLEENRAFEEVSFINLNGLETAKKSRTEDAPSLFDVSRLPKFFKTERGQKFIGDVYYTLSGPMLTLASPVRNRSNEIIQILAAEVNLSQIVRSVEKSYLGITGYLVVVDGRGQLIAHRGRGVSTGADLSGIEGVRSVLGGESFNGLGEKDRYVSFFSSVPVVGSAKKIAGIGWAVLAEWPLNDADLIIQGVRNQVLLLAVSSIIAVFILALIFAKRLVAPIRALEQGAAEIEKGNFEKQVIVRTGDELEDLGSAFNRMAKGLKKLKELQEEFLFIAAHDLKSPVVVIKGYLDMILGGEAGIISDKAREFLGEAGRANKRIIQLVEDLLMVARSESGKISVEVRPFDIAQSIAESIEELKPLADAKFIRIDHEPLPQRERVMADQDRVKEVMANLISNAIKYSPEKSSIKIFHQVKNDRLITHVGDNGYGIPKEYHGKVFEKFFHAAPKEEKEGVESTGLGLFIVKQLVEKMNGRVWFESEEGKGSVFSFSLRLYS